MRNLTRTKNLWSIAGDEMDKFTVFPNATMKAAGPVSSKFLNWVPMDLSMPAAMCMSCLMILFKEKLGSCTTKHALIATLAAELGLPIEKAIGLGSKLVAHAEDHARNKGIKSLYLLTNTAEAFFKHRGYKRTGRDDAPLAIRETKELSENCPVSSAFMAKHL
jgi:hypothetical protein